MKLKHFKELDGVRALAALSIMFLHFFQNRVTTDHFFTMVRKIAFLGQGGVPLFFVLSGFLITRILFNTKNSSSYFRDFYIRRALRIFPLYYLFLIITYWLIPPLQHYSIPPFGQQIWYWVHLQNIAITFNWPNSGPGQFWSLAIEEHFYFIWPIIVYYFDIKKIRATIILMILLSFLMKFLLLSKGVTVFFFTLTRMDELAIGALLALIEIKGELAPKNLRKFIMLFIAAILPAAVIFINLSGKGLYAVQFIKFTLMAAACLGLIASLIVIDDNHWLKKLFKIKPLTYTGKISYGLYVFHPLCYYLAYLYFKPASVYASFIECFGLTYVVAGLSFYLYESRFLALKRKLSYNS